MGSTSYNSMLRDARWQRKRLEIMERDGFKCGSCGKGENDGITLNVHHAYYIKGKKPWEYPRQLLTTRCSECHEQMHNMQNLLLEGFARMGQSQQAGLVELAYINVMPDFLDLIHQGPPVADRSLTECVRALKFAYDEGFCDSDEGRAA